ncbi:MAG: metalloregulator ArsR/SmtB family transcription factor [Candidatus Omnitrophota bacterium]
MKQPILKNLEQAAFMLRTVAHPARIEIINLLKQRSSLAVGEIQQSLGITQSMTSQHLALLKKIGIVDYTKKANACFYYLKNKNVLKLIDCVQGCCSAKSL